MNDDFIPENTMKPKFLTSNTCRVKKAFFTHGERPPAKFAWDEVS